VRQRLLDREVGALHVDRELTVEERLVALLDRREEADAGVDEQDVDPAGQLRGLGDDAIDVGELRHVRLDGAAVRAERGLGLLQRLGIAARDDHAGAFAGEGLGGRQADAAVAAGDECDLALETVLGHGRLLITVLVTE
jgi:hypothetical protein